MSRTAQPKAGSGISRPAEQDGELHLHKGFSALQITPTDPSTDICPVCKSSRYLNKSMRFLVNPECYHKMCESCVDRIFSHGPNKCPIAGCKRTLRKHRFREQTFEDIAVEREVDIRKRIAAIFNRREDEFEDLRAYNDYLNEVEDLTFNLIHNIDVDATEKRLQAYAASNSRAISENAAMASQEVQNMAALQAAEREQAKLRREMARREEEQDRRERIEGRANIINRLASSSDVDAAQIAEDGQKVLLKKRLDRQAQMDRQRTLAAAADSTNGSSGLVIKGLKAKKTAEPEGPFDAFGGLEIKRSYAVLQERYEWQWLNEARDDLGMMAGGYDLGEFQSRALCEAFSGLGVFIADETAGRMNGGGDAAVSTVGAAVAGSGAKDVTMDDPF